MKLATLCYVRKDGRTLMVHRIKKANDIHQGKWNGLGGKLEPGETPEECASREILEESGLRVKNLKLKGFLTFPLFARDEDWYAFVFVVDEFEGELIELSRRAAGVDRGYKAAGAGAVGRRPLFPGMARPAGISSRGNLFTKTAAISSTASPSMNEPVYPLQAVRTLALYAQGLCAEPDGRPAPTMQEIQAAVERMGCVQIDTLQMVQRSQYLVPWSRLGNYDTGRPGPAGV